MNSFIRIYCPLEEVCKIFCYEGHLSNDEINSLLQAYLFPGTIRKRENILTFITSAILLQNTPELKGSHKSAVHSYFKLSEQRGPIQLLAFPVKEYTEDSDATQIRKFIQTRLAAGIYGVTGFGANNQLVNFPPESSDYTTFSFEIDISLNGTATAVNIAPYNLGNLFIADMCNDYRIFGRVSYVANRAFFTPLNTKTSSTLSLKVYIGDSKLGELYL